jgi:hypothetical protein
MQSQLDSSRYARSILSNSTRREVLWNVLEPGDPYDIKKSMIAKLPGDRKIFMGDHLDMVCLLQAAEIERLCEFLDDYKLKYALAHAGSARSSAATSTATLTRSRSRNSRRSSPKRSPAGRRTPNSRSS